ncbi:MAG: D-ribose pyranase [Gammaproteobacteria bacterium]|nr:D-ribose pyranase [Gammaproteobacteria bacterium]
MKKTALLNAPISGVIARLGHGDSICIADAGLPIPNNVFRIDLALVRGIPSFLDVLDAVVTEMTVEKVLIASELINSDSSLHSSIASSIKTLEQDQSCIITLSDLPHEEFKRQIQLCRAVIRTGESTPYANVILSAGVSF